MKATRLLTCLFSLVALAAASCGEVPRKASVSEQWAEQSESPQEPAGETAAVVADPQRKIIYDAELRLTVTDFERVEREIPKLVKEHGGYLADVSVRYLSGRRRAGEWTARVPAEKLDQFIEAVLQLGVPESKSLTANDVTEEYMDLEARIATKKQLEKRILDLVAAREGELKDVLEVERELARVRSEIEQLEGRLRYLKNRVEYSTVEIEAREVIEYMPPQAPTFLARIDRAFFASLRNLRSFGEATAIALVAAAPWCVVLLVVLTPAWLVVRRRRVASGDR